MLVVSATPCRIMLIFLGRNVSTAVMVASVAIVEAGGGGGYPSAAAAARIQPENCTALHSGNAGAPVEVTDPVSVMDARPTEYRTAEYVVIIRGWNLHRS